MADDAPNVGTYSDKSDVGDKPADLVRLWKSAIALAGDSEKDWRKKAEEAESLYQAEAGKQKVTTKPAQFNILYTNVETLVPALYNSTPAPDCRRRFGDADEIAKLVAQITERAISVTVDQQDFDSLMLASVQDGEVAGRGVPRVRYVPRMGEPAEQPAAEEGMAEQPQAEAQVVDERVEYEHIDWRNLRLGPAKRWEMLPWIAFEHFMTREQLKTLSPEHGTKVKLDVLLAGVDAQQKKDGEGNNPAEVFKRAKVWEIWDKERRELIFIADGYSIAPLRVEPDPLELEGFFPIPRPYYGFQKAGTLVPTVPYSLYESQANELEDITRRLKRLIKVLRWRGIAAQEVMGAFESLKNMDDGEMAPSKDGALWVDKGLEKSVWMMPIEQAIAVAKELYIAREAVKQTIFEITGVADIMRGASDPNETLGAQKIKAQWSSLRLNRRQMEVARLARDLFRLTVEVITRKFSWQTISMMTGIKLPAEAEKQQAMQMAQQLAQQNPQGAQQAAQQNPEVIKHFMQPSQEAVESVLRRDVLREYRVDIESDSTIKADTERTQQNVANFVMGLGQFFTGIGPAVESGYMPADTAAALLTGVARNFKLGKQAEDALDRLQEQAKEAAQQPKQDPEMAKAEAEGARMKMKTEAEIAASNAKAGNDMQIARAKATNDAKIREDEAKHAAAVREAEAVHAAGMQTTELNHKTRLAEVDQHHAMTLAQRKADQDGQIAQQGADTKNAIAGMQADHKTLNEGVTGQTKQMVQEAVGSLADGLGQGLNALAQALDKLAESQTALARIMSAPRKVTRDKATGRADGVEIVMPTIQ